MDLLATYGDDGEKSESPGPSSDVGEKDASPVVARVPSFTPYLQAEWESFEKLIAGGGGEGGEGENEPCQNVQMVQPIPPPSPPVGEFSDGSNPSQGISKGELEDDDDNNTMAVKSHLHNESPFHGYSSNSSSHSTSTSRSSSLDRDSKKINEEVIHVASRSPSRSIEQRSSSNSPIAIMEESPNRHSGSDSPVHSSPSRSQTNSTSRYSREPLPEHRRGEKSRSRSHSRSRSRSHRRSRSRSRGSRQRRKKYSHRSRSRSRKHRRSRSPHKKSKHRRRSRHRSRECGRSRSRDRFGRNMRGRDSYRDRSPASSRRRSRSCERIRDRDSYRGTRDYGRRDTRDGGSSRNKKKPLNYKEQMRQDLTKASKMLESNIGSFTDFIEEKKILEPSSDQPTNAVLANLVAATQNATVTPQVALLQTMAAMHKKAQEMTGIAVPKYYNPAAVNPLKYAEQVQKRKLLWSRTPKEKKEGGPENQWQGTHFSTDQDGKMAAKFRKLMGMKSGEQDGTERVGEERKKKQEELFSRLDKEYEFARMTTHTHRGVGLGFQSQNLYQN